MKRVFPLFFLLLFSLVSFSQAKKIKIIYSGYSYADEEKHPGASILIRDKSSLVKIEHEGAILTCKKALYYKRLNFFKAFGNVVIKQGDTITQTSDYADYDGNLKQALSWGNVILTDPNMTLSTDTLHFDRITQKLFYKNYATIKDSTNTLKSKIGTYYLSHKKFTATTKVVVTNPEHILESNHLDYYTNSALAYLYGPSTIKGKDNTIYTERGFYNTKIEISHFLKNSKIFFKERTIEGDSLYYNRRRGFASATNNIKLIDTVNNFVAKGNYAEYFELKDSIFIIKKAVAISKIEKDSMYIHGDTILVTGKSKKRIIRIYNDVKIFKSDLQGKCDSLHTNQITGLTRLFRNPVLWSGKSQITGDSIHLINNTVTEKLDSLKIFSNALIVELDTIINEVSSYNQIKGRNIFGKFTENKLSKLLVKGNAEQVFFNRNEKGVLETITKQECSNILFNISNNAVESIRCYKPSQGGGNTYPPSKLPLDNHKLKGFIWRKDEQDKTMEDIFKESRVKSQESGQKKNNNIENINSKFEKSNL